MYRMASYWRSSRSCRPHLRVQWSSRVRSARLRAGRRRRGQQEPIPRRARSASTHPPPAAESDTSNPSHPPSHPHRRASAEVHCARSSSFSFGFQLDEAAGSNELDGVQQADGAGVDAGTGCGGLVIDGLSSHSHRPSRDQSQSKTQSRSPSRSKEVAPEARAASSASTSSNAYKTPPDALSESESSPRLVCNKESQVKLNVQPAPSSNSTTGSSANRQIVEAIDSSSPKQMSRSSSLKKPQSFSRCRSFLEEA